MIKRVSKALIVLIFIISSFIISGCGEAVPEKELATAKKEIQRAEAAQANEFDEQNLNEARNELQAAKQFVKNEKNKEAKEKALNSILKARLAVKNSKIKLLDKKIKKVEELITEAKRFYANKIVATKFKKAVTLFEQSKAGKTKLDKISPKLTDIKLKTGETVAEYEKYIKIADAAIKAVTEAANLIESALIASRERIQKLEGNLQNTNNLLNQLQRDRLIAKNFKDKLENIKRLLNEANEYYKKFKFTENNEEALAHLAKAEQLAQQANQEATQLNTEGRAQLQAVYKQRADRAIRDARREVGEAERLYNSRVRPAGTRRNPWIPRQYRTTQRRATMIAQNSDTPNNNSDDNEQNQPSGTNQSDTSGDQSSPSTTMEAAPQGSQESQGADSSSTTQGSTGDSDIERELEQSRQQTENVPLSVLIKRMKEKLKSAQTKYNNGDFVGAWEDAEEAKRLAAKVRELSGGSPNSNNESASSSYTNVKIWKHYVVKWRRRNTDCLWRIALKFYRDATLWPIIWYANKLKIADPDLIFGGQKLAIPVVKNARRN